MKHQIQADSVVSDVYGEKFGWRMFDCNFLTQEVAEFLGCEIKAFSSLIRSRAGIKTVVEVGCGHGRFLESARQFDKSYIGIDLITWLVELGQWVAPLSDAANCKILSASVMDLDRVLRVHGYSNADLNQTVVFLPFNCLGNIPYLQDVLARLSDLGVDVIVSLFDPSPKVSEVRSEYYMRCGLKHPTIEQTSKGTVISSEDGFESIGFYSHYLNDLVCQYGYRLEESIPLSNLGRLIYFKSGNALQRKESTSLRFGKGYKCSIDIDSVSIPPEQTPVRFFGIAANSSPLDMVCQNTSLLRFSEKELEDSSNWRHELRGSNFSSPILILETKNLLNGDVSFIPIKRS